MKKIFLVLTLGLIFAFGAFGVVSASPQNITGSTILPETEQLKIAWSYSNFESLTETATSFNQPLDGRINFTTTDNYIWLAGSHHVDYSFYYIAIKTGTSTILIYEENWYNSNCGDNGDESCMEHQYVIFSTIGMTESQRTITSTDIDSGVTITYEDLNPAYNITYNLDGGANHIDNPATFVAGDLPITLEDPTPPALYQFVAWHDAVTLDSPITTITLENDIEIWAEYELIPPPPSMPELIFGALATIITSVVALFASMFSQDGIMRIFWTTENGLTFVGTLSLLLFGLALVRIGLHFVKRLLMFKD